MRKTVLTFGSISGVMIVILVAIHMSLWKAGVVNFDNGELFGYGSMIIALSMVFFGVKSFRDKHQNGSIRFGKAFMIGLFITLLASAFYVAGWEVYYQADDQWRETFMDQYAEHSLGRMREGGATEQQIDEARQQMSELKELYQIPVIRLAFTLIEILPVGLLVSLISAAILRKKEVLPA